MDQILKAISETAERIFSELPKPARSKILLTGGSAAYFYGSNRPFSNDVDFMIAKKEIPETEKIFNVKFEYFTKKPIFHSLKAIVNQSVTIDLIAESIIQPDNQDVEFKIELSGIVSKRKKEFLINGHSIFCVPKELLVLIKLLAGRGKKLNKYDLEDIYQIISKNEDFDFDYLKKLILHFCKPHSKSLPILIRHAEKIKKENNTDISRHLLSFLKSIQPIPESL